MLHNNLQKGEITTFLSIGALIVVGIGIALGLGFGQRQELQTNRTQAGGTCFYRAYTNVYNDQEGVFFAPFGAGLMTVTNDRNQPLTLNKNERTENWYLEENFIPDPTRIRGYAANDPATVTLSGFDASQWTVKQVFCTNRGVRGCPTGDDITRMNTAIANGTSAGLTIDGFRVNCGVDLTYGWILKRKDGGGGQLACERQCIYSDMGKCWKGRCDKNNPNCKDGIANANIGCSYGGGQCGGGPQEVSCTTGEPFTPDGKRDVRVKVEIKGTFKAGDVLLIDTASCDKGADGKGYNCGKGDEVKSEVKRVTSEHPATFDLNLPNVPTGEKLIDISYFLNSVPMPASVKIEMSECDGPGDYADNCYLSLVDDVVPRVIKATLTLPDSTPEPTVPPVTTAPPTITTAPPTVTTAPPPTKVPAPTTAPPTNTPVPPGPDPQYLLHVTVQNENPNVKTLNVTLFPCPDIRSDVCSKSITFEGRIEERSVSFLPGLELPRNVMIREITPMNSPLSWLFPFIKPVFAQANGKAFVMDCQGRKLLDGPEDEKCLLHAGGRRVLFKVFPRSVPNPPIPAPLAITSADQSSRIIGACRYMVSGRCSEKTFREAFADVVLSEPDVLKKISALCHATTGSMQNDLWKPETVRKLYDLQGFKAWETLARRCGYVN